VRPQLLLVPLTSPLPHTATRDSDQPTGAPLRKSSFALGDTHCFSLRLRAYHFFDNTAFSASDLFFIESTIPHDTSPVFLYRRSYALAGLNQRVQVRRGVIW